MMLLLVINLLPAFAFLSIAYKLVLKRGGPDSEIEASMREHEAWMKQHLKDLREEVKAGEAAHASEEARQLAEGARNALRIHTRGRLKRTVTWALPTLVSVLGLVAAWLGTHHYSVGTTPLAPIGVYWLLAALPWPFSILFVIYLMRGSARRLSNLDALEDDFEMQAGEFDEEIAAELETDRE